MYNGHTFTATSHTSHKPLSSIRDTIPRQEDKIIMPLLIVCTVFIPFLVWVRICVFISYCHNLECVPPVFVQATNHNNHISCCYIACRFFVADGKRERPGYKFQIATGDKRSPAMIIFPLFSLYWVYYFSFVPFVSKDRFPIKRCY